MKTALVCVSIGAVGPQGRKALDGAEQALAQAMPRASWCGCSQALGSGRSWPPRGPG